MKNKDYWMKRALLREEESAERTAKILERMYRLYQKAAKQISKDINSFILKYGAKHGLTYDQAAKKLNRTEYREWKKTLGEYVEEINAVTDPQERAKLVAQLDALSANSSISRLDALMAEIEQNMNRLYLDSSEDLRESFGDTFAESYYKKVYDMQSRAGRINDFAHIDKKTLEDILSYPWSGANFSDRLWKNKETLTFRLQEALTDSLIRGTSTAQLAKDLSDEMGKGFTAAETLIRTECSWLHGEADRRAYTAAGVAQYEYMATLDSRTSKVCADLDSKHFDLDKAQVGVNYPPMHPRCRSTTVEYDPEEASDWFNSGKEMPKNMTYKEWAATVEIPSMDGVGGMEKDRRAFREVLDRSDGNENMVSRLILYNDATSWIYDENAKNAFAYVPEKDAIVCNPTHEFYDEYDMVYAQTHELTHRADYLEFESWKNPKFKKAIEICQKRIYDKKEEVYKLVGVGGKYEADPAFSDIISALSKGDLNNHLVYFHKKEYWGKWENVSLEVFANISCIDVLGYSSKDEFSELLKEIYDAYKEVLK